MSEPPRLSQIQLPWELAIIYFITLCVKGRRRVLANPEVFEAIEATVAQLERWRVLAGVVTPDHAHFVITPTEDRGLSAGDFGTGFKRLMRKALGSQAWDWQRGCFDRPLRSDEDLHNKWIYLEQNPVRAGLVHNVSQWPYYLGSTAEQGSWQLPLQKDSSRK